MKKGPENFAELAYDAFNEHPLDEEGREEAELAEALKSIGIKDEETITRAIGVPPLTTID